MIRENPSPTARRTNRPLTWSTPRALLSSTGSESHSLKNRCSFYTIDRWNNVKLLSIFSGKPYRWRSRRKLSKMLKMKEWGIWESHLRKYCTLLFRSLNRAGKAAHFLARKGKCARPKATPIPPPADEIPKNLIIFFEQVFKRHARIYVICSVYKIHFVNQVKW